MSRLASGPDAVRVDCDFGADGLWNDFDRHAAIGHDIARLVQEERPDLNVRYGMRNHITDPLPLR